MVDLTEGFPTYKENENLIKISEPKSFIMTMNAGFKDDLIGLKIGLGRKNYWRGTLCRFMRFLAGSPIKFSARSIGNPKRRYQKINQ